MCLGVPGKVVSLAPDATGMTMGKVNFGGITKEVCMAYIPDAEVGDYVVVHVGFAISKIGEEEAAEVFEYLRQIGELDELNVPQPGEDPVSADAALDASPVPASTQGVKP